MIAPALLACAPHVAPKTLQAVIRTESKGNPWAINVNGLRDPNPIATDKAQAVRIAQRYMALGYRVDMGLMQISSPNLARLGYSVADAFDPCLNIRGGAAILTADYARAAKFHTQQQRALAEALSLYNTGSRVKGFQNGYVARYYGRQSPVNVRFTVGGARGQVVTVADPYTANIGVYQRVKTNVRIQ